MHILVDIGGTKTRVAASRDLESFDKPQIFSTQTKYAAGLRTIVESAKKLAKGEMIERVSVGAPGVITPDHQSLLTSPNLPDWKGKAISGDIESAIGAKVHMENDTALVSLGEALYGAGVGATTVMYLTVSTGVGSVRIVNGKIDAPSRSAEIGHMYFNTGEELQEFKNLVSGKSIHQRFGMMPRELGKDHPVWEELARIVAIGVHNSILHWTPDRIVLGGSMFNEIGISVARVQAHLSEIMKAFPQIPEIVHSSLGDVGGLWGGMARLKQLL
ncbi:MAG TPA: ROK family protein [Candidatus Paceibacterota bacterium]